MNSQAKFIPPAPLQACCRPMGASAPPEFLHPVPDPGQALAIFVQASSLVAFALAPIRQRRVVPGGISLQDLSGDAMQMLPATPLVLARSSHATLVCDKGTLWITQGDGNDYILKAGQRLVLAPRDKVIVKAMHGPAWVRCLS